MRYVPPRSVKAVNGSLPQGRVCDHKETTSCALIAAAEFRVELFADTAPAPCLALSMLVNRRTSAAISSKHITVIYSACFTPLAAVAVITASPEETAVKVLLSLIRIIFGSLDVSV